MSAANGTLRAAAAERYRASVVAGEPITPKALGEAFDRSRTWARGVIAEVTAADNSQGAASDHATGPEVAATATRVAATTDQTEADTGLMAATVRGPERGAGRVAATVAPEVPAWVGWVTTAAVLAVAAAAAVASVEHLAELARLAGVQGWRAWLFPAALDGLVVASSMCVYRAHLLAERAGLLAWSALLAGLSASIVGNVLSVYPELVPDAWLKVTVGVSAPVALALSFDLALRQTRRIAHPVAADAGEGRPER